ncbi:hypothetical protein JCM11672_32190 [Alkaliphilus crotonatoxidans]
MLKLLSSITSLLVIFFIAKGFINSKSSENKKKSDKKWVDVIFIQYLLIFVLGILGIFFLIFQLVKNQ